MNNDNGGPAFPCEGGNKFISGKEIRRTLPSSGMDLRDYFAAKAMQGLLTSGGDFEKFSHLATDAYSIADAMLAQRTK